MAYEHTEQLNRFNQLAATLEDVVIKGKSMPYTSLNGHMFSFLKKDGTMALRLPTEERNEFITAFGTELCVQHGRVMKEYVNVPKSLQEDIPKLKEHFVISIEYIKSLKPK